MKKKIVWFTPSKICPETGRIFEVSWINAILSVWEIKEEVYWIIWLTERIESIIYHLKTISDQELWYMIWEMVSNIKDSTI